MYNLMHELFADIKVEGYNIEDIRWIGDKIHSFCYSDNSGDIKVAIFSPYESYEGKYIVRADFDNHFNRWGKCTYEKYYEPDEMSFRKCKFEYIYKGLLYEYYAKYKKELE